MIIKNTPQFASHIYTSLSVFAFCAVTSCESPKLVELDPDKDNVDPDNTVVEPAIEPNIILMLADDMGFDDMSYRGNNAVNTPNLDSLARISTRFQNFYVHSVSAPTRASLLTGRHFLRCGISGLHAGRDFMNLDEVTIADALSNSGYATGMWGKWHSGKSNGYYPWQRGFNEAYMASLYHHSYNNGLYKGEWNGVTYNGNELSFAKSEGAWTDATITNMAIDFIKRNRDGKFFAYIPFLTPHENWDAPDDYISKYLSRGQSKNFATLNGMLSHLDYQVGRVIKATEDLGIADNTIIIFMSDNGPNYNKNLLTQNEWEERNPSQYKGFKTRNTENGIHSPLFIYWKGHTVAIDNLSLLGVCDIFPTLCELAGINPPANCKPLDGKSFKNLILSPSINDMSRTLYISHSSPFNSSGECLSDDVLTPSLVDNINPDFQHIGLRRGNDKLLLNEYNESEIAFWNLESDYREENNLYLFGTKEEKEKALSYKSELLEWYKGVLSDDGAYTITSFIVGDSNYSYSEVLCYAPIEITSGLRNENQRLSGFNKAGEGATYSINVIQEGYYDFRINLDSSKSIGDEMFTISTNLNSDIADAKFAADSYGSMYCRVYLSSKVETISIKLKNSTSREFALKNLRLYK